LEVDSVFNTLLRLRTALQENDIPGIGDALGRLDGDFDRLNFARSEIGARLQGLDTLKTRHEDEEVTLRSALTQEIDVDMAKAISEFTARQYAMQASLRTSASLLQMSIIDFI
jgi:flagellar hook-associated protein 3 FlgL